MPETQRRNRETLDARPHFGVRHSDCDCLQPCNTGANCAGATAGQGNQPPKVKPTLVEPPAQAKTSPQPATQPTATQTPNSKLLGMWIGRVADGTNATLVFREDGQVWSVNSGNATRTEIFTYTVDFSLKPAHLDTRDSSGKTSTTIIEFVDDNTIRIANVSSSTEGRPTSFGNDTLTFRRNSATQARLYLRSNPPRSRKPQLLRLNPPPSEPPRKHRTINYSERGPAKRAYHKHNHIQRKWADVHDVRE